MICIPYKYYKYYKGLDLSPYEKMVKKYMGEENYNLIYYKIEPEYTKKFNYNFAVKDNRKKEDFMRDVAVSWLFEIVFQFYFKKYAPKNLKIFKIGDDKDYRFKQYFRGGVDYLIVNTKTNKKIYLEQKTNYKTTVSPEFYFRLNTAQKYVNLSKKNDTYIMYYFPKKHAIGIAEVSTKSKFKKGFWMGKDADIADAQNFTFYSTNYFVRNFTDVIENAKVLTI